MKYLINCTNQDDLDAGLPTSFGTGRHCFEVVAADAAEAERAARQRATVDGFSGSDWIALAQPLLLGGRANSDPSTWHTFAFE